MSDKGAGATFLAFSAEARQRPQLHFTVAMERISISKAATTSTQAAQRPRSSNHANRSPIEVSTSMVPSCLHSASVVPPRRVPMKRSLSGAGTSSGGRAASAQASERGGQEPDIRPDRPPLFGPFARGLQQPQRKPQPELFCAWYWHRTTADDRPAALRPTRSDSMSSPAAPVPDPQPNAARKAASEPKSRRALGAGASPLPASATSQALSGSGPTVLGGEAGTSSSDSMFFGVAGPARETRAVTSGSSLDRHVTQATRCFKEHAFEAATCSAFAKPSGPWAVSTCPRSRRVCVTATWFASLGSKSSTTDSLIGVLLLDALEDPGAMM